MINPRILVPEIQKLCIGERKGEGFVRNLTTEVTARSTIDNKESTKGSRVLRIDTAELTS